MSSNSPVVVLADASGSMGQDFELCVGVNGAIEHWWRHNVSNCQWFKSATFGSAICRVVALLQGTYGTNLELIAERTDGTFEHYFRDGRGWQAAGIVT